MAATAAASLSLHLRLHPPPHAHRSPPRHAPFLLSPSPSTPWRPHHLHVANGRLPPPCRPSVKARAGTIEAPSLARLGGAVETDRLPADVRDRAMNAVDHFGGRVTIGDVASRAGLQIDQAERALQALAADTGGFLEVSGEGEVLYVFPEDYRAKLAGKSLRMRVEPLVDKAKEAGAYVVRVSFGTALVASIVLVYATIIAILSSSSDDDNRGRRRRSYGSTMFLPTDLFWYLDAGSSRRRRVEKDKGMSFIESVFSFVFGNGDPNDGLEERRWKMIGQYISSNGGVVTAEELAPYLDVPAPAKQISSKDDESFILPVLLCFQGHPLVDDQTDALGHLSTSLIPPKRCCFSLLTLAWTIFPDNIHWCKYFLSKFCQHILPSWIVGCSSSPRLIGHITLPVAGYIRAGTLGYCNNTKRGLISRQRKRKEPITRATRSSMKERSAGGAMTLWVESC